MKVLKALFLMWYKHLIKDSLKMLINIIRQFLVNGYWKNFRPDTGYRKKRISGPSLLSLDLKPSLYEVNRDKNSSYSVC